jgi:hypothetical protein
MEENEFKNVWEYRVKKIFEQRTRHDQGDLLWNLITLFLYSSSKDRLLIDIYNFFEDKNQFVKFISLVDGRLLKTPTKKEIEEALLTAVFYYEKKVNGKSWKEIQDSLDFKVSSIKYGIKVRNLNNWISQKLQEVLDIEDKTDG